MIQRYQDLRVYQEAYRLAIGVHKKALGFPEIERHELGSQLRRAATSIPANIAEGYGRKNSAAEFKHFLRNALGSANEVRVFIDMAKDLEYISVAEHAELSQAYEALGKQLYRLIEAWQKQSDI